MDSDRAIQAPTGSAAAAAAVRPSTTATTPTFQIELYFLQDASQLRQPLNLRNEAAAVSLLLGFFAEHRSDGEGGIDARAQQALLAELLRHGRTLWPELASGNVTVSGSSSSSSAATVRGEPVPADSPAGEFEAWAVQQGVAAGIQIASFDGLRGCAASRNVAPGDLLLSIPSDVLIYQDSVLATDLVSRAAVHTCRLLAFKPGV